ncbi:hypothetical protein [Jannaschia sp. M317]|uniref:hypothetical protein n=1 Tax=Jannaschia sp. M317 TaxID=2867011 RepID=UPI0021A623D0|nr:hypothetical protein [Jannaschia sp. M317]UWQ16151.1 hypothetical protein K3551_09385 [Jannaschia sp. M317]
MKFEVLRHHEGDRSYVPGDLRDAQEGDVAHLVASGVLRPAGKAAQAAANKAVKAAPKNKAG